MARSRGTAHPVRVLPGVVVAAVLLAGCTQAFSAERDGRDLGESLCDLRDASTAEEVEAEAGDIAADLDEMAEHYAMFTAEDRAAITRHLTDLRTHVAQGEGAQAQQDLASIRQSLGGISDGLDDASRAGWDGVEQGLDGCITT